jgi:ubiquinone/menaquinone biosynthesis C-methylase UbiE
MMTDDRRIVPWTDPDSGEILIEKNNTLVGANSVFQMTDGIPNFVAKVLDDDKQEQVKVAFGYKWTRTNFGQDDRDFDRNIKNKVYEFMGLDESDLSMFDGKVILDVGVGSGSSARVWAGRAKEFHGVDISRAVYRARNALKSCESQPVLSQADLNRLPYPNQSFDVIVSNGVLHHTSSTKTAIKNVITKLKRGGKFLFYIYKKKAPIREFTDDFVRGRISDLPAEQAWEKMRPITSLARSLHEQSIKVVIPEDVDLIGIRKGEYDLQRFLYQFFFKCFWNKEFGFEDSNMINFDWYYPKYAWRHTEQEIREWCDEFGLEVEYIKENESGYGCLVRKK